MRIRVHRSLAEFLRDQMYQEGIRSTRELGERIGVSQGTAWRLISSPRVPKEETLRLIAAAFDVPIVEVRELAERPTGATAHFELPPEADQLDPRERDLVVETVWVILRARTQVER